MKSTMLAHASDHVCHNNTCDTHGDNNCWYMKIINFIPETIKCAEYKVNKKIINRTSFCTVTPAQHHVKLTAGLKMTYNDSNANRS